MSKAKTQEEFENELHGILPNIEVLGKYINTNTKIRCKCLIHEYEFNSLPMNLLHGHGCKKCGQEKLSSIQTKNHDKFVDDAYKVNQDVDIIGTYIDIKHRVKCRCKIDGYEWEPYPRDILRGKRCPVCSNRIVVHGINDIATIRPDLVKYFKNKNEATIYTCGSEQYIDIICPECLTPSKIKITNLTRFGFSCNSCYEKKYGRKRVPRGYWNKDTMCKYLNENYYGYKLLDIQKPSDGESDCLKALIKCPNEKHVPYWASWNNITRGYKCILCSLAETQSNGEKLTENILNKYCIDFEPQKRFDDCKDKYTLPFDFYLPYYNLVIEIMGEQHEHPVEIFGGEDGFNVRVEHDRIKRDYLKNHNISILDIWYYDFDKIEDIILNELNVIDKISKILSLTTQTNIKE